MGPGEPLLRPGTHLLRRDAVSVQAGLGASERLVLPAPAPGSPLGRSAVAGLLRAGLAARDEHVARTAIPPADPWQRHTLAAVARRCDERLSATLERRRACRVRVSAGPHPLDAALAADLVILCERAGLRLRAPGERLRAGAVDVLVGVGEPAREELDGYRRDGTAHLLVRFVEGRAGVGPFVVPGRTACLRCIDAYLTEQDPAWPLLVAQYARVARRDRADGIPEPVDAALAAIALGWAARDVATWAEGGRPTTWSSVVTIAPDLTTVDRHSWPMHANCGCTW